MKDLDLDILGEGLPAVSKSVGRYLAEAGAFCLEREKHKSPVVLSVSGDFNEKINVSWKIVVTPQIERSWNDTEEATEYGAVGTTLILVPPLLNMNVVLRSRKGDGVDYWLGEMKGENEPELMAGLEISGIARASKDNSIKSRFLVKKKRLQNEAFTSLPVFVAIIEFGNPTAHFEKI